MKYKYQLESTIRLNKYHADDFTLLRLTDIQTKKTHQTVERISETQNPFYNNTTHMLAVIRALIKQFHPEHDLDSSKAVIEIQKNIKDVKPDFLDIDCFTELWDVFYAYGDDE